MARAGIQDRLRAVLLYIEGVRESREIAAVSGISVRTLRRWVRAYRRGGLAALEAGRPGPGAGTGATSKRIEKRVLTLKQKHPSWGARRIKNQYGLACHWTTVHRIIKRHGMLVRIKPKPQPSKRFQRYHVDSMWQGDTFEFRIASVGKVYVTGFTDDRSRFRIRSGAYLHKGAKESVDALERALRKGRTPRELYLDNGKQFIAKGVQEGGEEPRDQAHLRQALPSKRERQDRELSQGPLEGPDLAGPLRLPSSLQERAEEVRRTIQPLEEAGTSWMEHARVRLQRREILQQAAGQDPEVTLSLLRFGDINYATLQVS
jgi:transposase